ncbi:hypothetical protein ACI7RC_16585 [Brevibacillus sp. B_LB10_24]|uniref:hypothetical protein n=1 Tax=Brevibacillus sp. B_LB10_24 TaxID=3380645 RepID=UPI0038BD2066
MSCWQMQRTSPTSSKDSRHNEPYMEAGEAVRLHFAVRDVRQINLEKAVRTAAAFFVVKICGGITPDGISDYDMEEALCSAQMVQRSEQAYVLADGAKIAETQLYRICRPEDVTAIICDQPMPDHWRSTGCFTEWITAGRPKGEET